MVNGLYCKIYLQSELSLTELQFEIAKKLHGQIHGYSILIENIEIDVSKSNDFDEKKSKEFPDGFLYFKYTIEVFGNNGKIESFLNIVSCVLEFFWAKGTPAVAACDFEQALPQKGGYKSKNIPWILNDFDAKW